MRSLLVAALSLVAIGGCSTEPKTHAATSTAANDRKCFFSRNVNGFEALDGTLVNIHVGVKDVYQLTLFNPCYDIDWAHSITLVSRAGSNFCTGDNTAEIVAPGPFGIQRCDVRSLRYLTPEDAAAQPKGKKP